MAGRGKKKLSKNSTVANWLVGIYTRRSFDDNEEKESNTITNQKEMINNFVSKENNMTIVDYYVDDGYTGTDFDRPAFQEMMDDIRNKKIGFVLQDFGLIEDETVTENILVPTLFNSIKNVNIKLEEILNKLEIGDLRNKKVSMLSGGQRQRVAIARALITNPELILADEPTGSLDSITTIHIMNIFEQLNKEGKTIIIVTHNLELAKKTKKCFTIKDGLIYKA